jgi:thiamine-phosphate pyrophosphorylase
VTRLPTPPFVCLITEGQAHPQKYPTHKQKITECIRDAAREGVSLIQIREKRLPGRMLHDLVSAVLSVTSDTDARVLVNDRADVAISSGAAGVHLPESSFAPGVLRARFGEGLLIGVSTHSIDAAVSAASSGADFVFFGPVFDTPGKGTGVGLEVLERVCRRLDGFPVIALGGIDPNNCRSAIDAGAAGVAAIRSLNAAGPRRDLLAALGIRRSS